MSKVIVIVIGIGPPQQASMSNCSILRIGPIDSENGNASRLRDAIARHFQCGGENRPRRDENNFATTMTISNRYFDASILLLGLDESIDAAVEKAGAMPSSSIRHEEDGILLVFDASVRGDGLASFDSLGRVHATAIRSDRAGDLLRLCVGTYNSHDGGPSPSTSDGSKGGEAEYSRRVLWCLDRGYEYVEADVSKEGLERGHDERDKDGFARVVEAVGTCMWSSRVMKKRGDVVGGGLGGGGDGGGNVVRAGATSLQKDSIEKKDVEEEGATSSSPAYDADREKAAMASLMRGMNDDDRPAGPGVDAPYEDGENARQQQQQSRSQQLHPQEEISLHQLESVLSEARLIRDASKNDSMTDDERRGRAGDAAMKLMGLLDRLGFEDEDDDAENEGSSSSDDEGMVGAIVNDQSSNR